MATTSLTLEGHSAGSPEPILGPSPATGQDAEILDVSDPDLGYDAEKSVSAAPTADEIDISRRAVGRVLWQHCHLRKSWASTIQPPLQAAGSENHDGKAATRCGTYPRRKDA